MALVLSTLLAACGGVDDERGRLLLGWTFVDGRICADSGVEQIRLLRPGQRAPLGRFGCSAGFGAATVPVELEPGDHSLGLLGVSRIGTALYRGELRVAVAPPATVQRVVALSFVGGT